MIGILSAEAFALLGAPDLVYVRPLTAGDLFDSLADAEKPRFSHLMQEPDRLFYAIHTADGDRIAVYTTRQAAITDALAHERAPVSVH